MAANCIRSFARYSKVPNESSWASKGMRLAFSSFFSGAIGNLIHESSGDSLPVSFRNFTPRDRFVLDHTLKALRLGADMTAIEA